MNSMSSTENAIVRLQAKVDQLEKEVSEMKGDVKQIQASVTEISIAIARSEEAMKNTARYFGILFTIGMAVLSGAISLAVRFFVP